MKTKTKINNRLWQARRRAGLEQKQVARFLGHKNCDQISRYERGARMPGLRIALKLELLYRTPVSDLFPEHYHKYRREIAAITAAYSSLASNHFPADGEERPGKRRASNAHVCTYGNSMLQKNPKADEVATANKHTIDLIQKIAEIIHRRRTSE